MNYPDLMAMASRFIDTLTCGILEKYSIIAEAFSSQSVSPVSHRQSLSFIITKAEVTFLSELKQGQVNYLSNISSLTHFLQTGQTHEKLYRNILE